ncbi:hypothetical protein [Aquabacterium sp.]|uniref:hypothetical protein n=1 Tax=Aquabacterium sp. TaxID=1872578 RepID=UPI002BDDC269|nr:hypothetical protein [Aquabacterium sp.]HSW07450.1 hypothetical protein [Aquabacterium sp.]
MTSRLLFARLLAAAALALAAVGASAALTPGASITALQDGSPSLLGADSGYAAGPGSNVTALSDSDLEFLTADFAIGIDFFSSGLLQLYDNGGSGLAGSTVLAFDFSGLAAPLGSVSVDLSALLSGSVTATLLNDHTLQLTLSDVQLADSFGPLGLQLQTVPEPAPLALLAAAALGAALQRRAGRRGH